MAKLVLPNHRRQTVRVVPGQASEVEEEESSALLTEASSELFLEDGTELLEE